ncbi:DUF6912 family protein [Glycomyces buryatensis]|uniref:DUF6912 family protein n=1 Tax=Glycomyces buryatensis TaxID=2570927 RepID=UPI001B3C14A0|nr:hypothetical protein [Glycomyces buryatensis]
MPASTGMLRGLADSGELKPAGPVHTVTASLRREYPDVDVEDLEYTAFADAGLASLPLLVGHLPRRVVISADVPDERVTEHGEGTGADFDGSVKLKRVAAIHVDDADAAVEIAEALGDPEAADLDAVEAHVLDWYAPTELQDLLATLNAGTA